MNSVTRMPQQQIVDPASQWFWNGSQWVCGDCDQQPQPCPPFPPTAPPWFPPPPQQPPWYPGANAGVSFSPTAPPNPIRGAFWWDGQALWLFDGAAWVVVGGSGSGGTTPPSSTAPANPVPGQQWFNGSTLFVWDGNAWIPVSQTKTYLQATAPPAPNPGDLWFDGTQLHIWSGSAWDLVGPGATVGPVPTTTEVFVLTAGASIGPIGSSSGNVAIVPFTTTPQVDTMNGWNVTTKQYMPKTAGNYLFFTKSYMGGGETQSLHALIKNDSGSWQALAQTYVTVAAIATGGGTGDYLVDSGVAHMNGTTDFVRLWAGSSDSTLYTLGPTIPVIHAWLLP